MTGPSLRLEDLIDPILEAVVARGGVIFRGQVVEQGTEGLTNRYVAPDCS